MLHQSVRLQALDVVVDSEALALELQPHITEVNRQRFVPMIARVLEEFDIPDQHISIAKIDIDLGELSVDDLEQTAELALQQALRQAIEEALQRARERPSTDEHIRPDAASRLDLFAHYLLRGTLPFWAKADDVSTESHLVYLVQNDPDGLVALVRRLGHDRHVLERLAMQFDGVALEQLLHLLTPQQAALILAYMSDLRQTQRVVSLVTIGETAFAQALWLIVLNYLLRDPGSQFNRKSFVRSLIDEIAEREGVDEGEFLRALQRGLRETQHRQSLASSLPAVIAELVHDEFGTQDGRSAEDIERANEHTRGGGVSRLDLLARALLRGADVSSGAGLSAEQLVDLLLVEDPDGLKTFLYRHDRQQHVVRHLVERLGDPVLQRLLALVDAQHAVLIVTYLVALRDVHRRDVLLKWSDDRFARLLWFLVFTYVLRDPGTLFNRKSFVRSLLTGVADREIVGYVDLLLILQRGLRRPGLDPSSASLLAVIDDLADEIDRPIEQGAASDTTAGDPLAMLARYLATGRMPDGGALAPQDLFHEAVAQDAGGTALLLWRIARSPSAHAALIDRLLPYVDIDDAASLFETTIQTAVSINSQDGHRNEAMPDRSHAAADARSAWAALLERIGTATRDERSPAFDRRATEETFEDGGPVELDKLSGADIDHYDTVEISRAVLRHGVLPWNALSREPGAAVEQRLAMLSELPSAHLRRVFAGSADERLQLAERAMQRLPEQRILAMLTRLITQTSGGESFRSALASVAREARSRPAFYARALLALLDQAPLDLEQAAGEASSIAASTPGRASDPAQWDAATLKSELVAGLTRDGALGSGHLIEKILQALVLHESADAAQFLWVIADRRDILPSLLRQVAPEPLQSLLTTLYPAEVALARALLDILATVVPHRLPAERRHALAVETVFDVLHNAPADAIVRTLRRAGLASRPEVAPPPLPQQGAAVLPDAYRAAYEAAWTRLAVDVADPIPDDAKVERGPSPRLRDAALDWLRGAGSKADSTSHRPAAQRQLSRDLLADTIERLIAADPGTIAALVAQSASDDEQRERWVRGLSEPTLMRLVSVVAPGRRYWAHPMAEVLVTAWREVAPAGQRPVADRALFWSFLLETMSTHGDRLTPDRFLTVFVARTAATDQNLAARLFERAGAFARNAGHAWLLPILARSRSGPRTDGTSVASSDKRAASDAQAKQKSRRGKTAFSLSSEDDDGGTPIYIDNAGLILTGPFLPHLFQTLDLLRRDDGGRQRLRDGQCVSRAAHLLQYLVDGRIDTPEPRLVLNKILCGVPAQVPVARAIEATDAERTLCDHLLNAMIANWTIIAQTSVAGLRETFLQREGKLQRTDDGWKLRVQRKTVDVLVDQVPWNHTIIFQGWMPQPLHVTW